MRDWATHQSTRGDLPDYHKPAMTEQEMERVVRASWEHLELHRFAEDCWEVAIGGELRGNSSSTPAKAWAAAYAYTLAHKAKIAECEAEIAWINGMQSGYCLPEDYDTATRLLTKSQKELAALRMGWKGDKDGNNRG